MLYKLKAVLLKDPEIIKIIIYFCFTILIFYWGAREIINEIKVDNSYTKTSGKIIRTGSFFWVNQTARIKYSYNGVLFFSRIRCFTIDKRLKVNDEIVIRISTKKPSLISLDIDIGNRIIPSLIYIFISFVFASILIPAVKRKIELLKAGGGML